MRDGRTRPLNRGNARSNDIGDFLARFRAKVVVLSGPSTGREIPLDRDRITIGRGPAVDVEFDDPTMSRQHAAIEYSDSRFRIRDLGSTNGVAVNETPVPESDLDHGDRFDLGDLRFQLLIEEAESEVEAYELPAGV